MSVTNIDVILITGPAGPQGPAVTVIDAINDGNLSAVTSNAVFDGLALKAPIASPSFTGPVNAPGGFVSDNGSFVASGSGFISTASGDISTFNGQIYSVGTNAKIYTNGASARIETNGASAHIKATGGGNIETSLGQFIGAGTGLTGTAANLISGAALTTTRTTAQGAPVHPTVPIIAIGQMCRVGDGPAYTWYRAKTVTAWELDDSRQLGDVFNFGAAGSSATTTGSVSTGTNQLTVASTTSFKVGDGIFIAGAGAAGVRLVSKISSISGLVLTLRDNASTTVSSVAVKHDDSEAINAAIAYVHSKGGGVVYFPIGLYRCAAPLHGVTNSVITFPITAGYELSRITISLVGEALGSMTAGYAGILPGGCSLDFTDAVVSGTHPSALSTALYVEFPAFGNIATEWNSINVIIERLLFFCPIGMSGINLHNCLQGRIKDEVVVAIKATAAPVSLLQPSLSDPSGTGSIGIDMPAVLNNIVLDVGSCGVSGFEFGIQAGEHTFFKRPNIIFCKNGLKIPLSGHLISGDLSIENCVNAVLHTGGVDTHVDLRLQCEMSDTLQWWRNIYGWSGNSLGRGRVCHVTFNKQTDGPDAFYLANTGKIFFEDLRRRDQNGILFLQSRSMALGSGNITPQNNPTVFSLGGEYGNNALGNQGNSKLTLYYDLGNGHVGTGVSTGGAEYYCFAGGSHTWYASPGASNPLQTAVMALTTAGALSLPVVGRTLSVKVGTNAMAGTVTLASGVATITSTAITTDTIIMMSLLTQSGTPALASPLAKVNAGTANITGAVTDNSTYNWIAMKKY